MKEPTELLRIIKNKINQNDILAAIVVFALGLINNFIFFTTEGVAPDSIQFSDFYIAKVWEISLGRYGIPISNLIRFGLVNKFIIIIISLTFLALSVIVITRTFKIKNKVLIFFISTIIAIAPQFTETYMFIYCADAYCLAFLLSTLTVYFLNNSKNKIYYYILAAISTIIVCSLYQAYLGVIIGLTIILLMQDLMKGAKIKDVFIKSIKYVITIFLGVLIYYIILKVIIHVLGISLASYKGANSLGIDTIKSLPKTIVQTYKDFFNFFFTNKIINNTYWKRNIINIILFAISTIGIINIIIKGKFNSKIRRALLMILLIAIYPIGISIMNLIAPNTSINLVTGPGLITAIILISLIYKNLSSDSLNNIIKYCYIITLLILSYTFILQNTFTYMCRQETYENYRMVTNNIYTKATELEGYSVDKKWMFSDVIKFKPKYNERANGFISNNNETWDDYGGTTQNANYYEKYFGIKINICSKKEYADIVSTDEFKQMPIYPNDGSIKIINNTIVIKISNQTF